VLHSGVTRVSFSAHCRPVADSADITDGLEIMIQGSWPGISARVLGRAWSKKLLAGGLERDEARIGRQTGLGSCETLGTIVPMTSIIPHSCNRLY
jgi:hypothetical protein